MDPITLLIVILLVLIVFGNVVYVPQDLNHGGILWAMFLVLMIVLIVRIAKGGRPLVLLAALSALALNGCHGNMGASDRVVSHEESDKAHWLDSGRTKSESTTVAKPDGTKVTESKSVVTPPPSN